MEPLASKVYNNNSRHLSVTDKLICCLCPLMQKTHWSFKISQWGWRTESWVIFHFLFKYKCAHHMWPTTFRTWAGERLVAASECLDFLHLQRGGCQSVNVHYSFSHLKLQSKLWDKKKANGEHDWRVSDVISVLGSTSSGLLLENWGPSSACSWYSTPSCLSFYSPGHFISGANGTQPKTRLGVLLRRLLTLAQECGWQEKHHHPPGG